jgi:hypothetical protein
MQEHGEKGKTGGQGRRHKSKNLKLHAATSVNPSPLREGCELYALARNLALRSSAVVLTRKGMMGDPLGHG